MSPPPEVRLREDGSQILEVLPSGEPYRQYLDCAGGCGYVIGCGDALESVYHESCGKRIIDEAHGAGKQLLRINPIEELVKASCIVGVDPGTAFSTGPVLVWASGSVVRGVVGEVTVRAWEAEVGSADEYAASDQVDGVVAITTVWRPGAREIEIDVLGTEEAAVAAAWDLEAEEAARKTVV